MPLKREIYIRVTEAAEYIRATGAEQLWEHVDRTIEEGGKRDG